MCHADRDEMILMQHITAEIILQSLEAEIHTIFDLSYTNISAIEMQETMYLKFLMTKKWDLNSTARHTQHQLVEDAISPYGKGDNDKYFDAHRCATEVQAE